MKPDINKNIKAQKLLSVLITAIGIVLLVFMITVESEPGAIPLLLITFGTGWYFVTRYRIQSRHT